MLGQYLNLCSPNLAVSGLCCSRVRSVSSSPLLQSSPSPKEFLTEVHCRKRQVNGAGDLLGKMLNKRYVPDAALTCNTLLNSLCRKRKLREAYKLLCRMKVRGCNPGIVHYNTVILSFCREGVASDACKFLAVMSLTGCLPNLVSYQTLVSGLFEQGMLDEVKKYVEEMMRLRPD